MGFSASEKMLMQPLNAIAAASHVDPYPYYRQLLAGPPLQFDAGLGLWIASRAAVIADIMANPDCQVRPAAEAVPKAIAGSSAGNVFGRLMRMNEGAAHANPKRVIGHTLAGVDLDRVAERSAHLAAALGTRLPDGAALTRWLFDLPTYVVADLLGFGEHELPQVAQSIAQFVRCLSPLSTPEQLASASSAAHDLLEMFKTRAPAGLADTVLRLAAQEGWNDRDAILSNLLGLMSQTHEATAGLIGNSIVAMLARPELRSDPQRFVREVARLDPAVQNTRRFVVRETRVAEVTLQPGEVILLLLGATGHDEQAPVTSQLPGFGHGRHACPGQELAFAIAAGALKHLLTLDLAAARLSWTYAPSANARLPQFSSPALKGSP